MNPLIRVTLLASILAAAPAQACIGIPETVNFDQATYGKDVRMTFSLEGDGRFSIGNGRFQREIELVDGKICMNVTESIMTAQKTELRDAWNQTAVKCDGFIECTSAFKKSLGALSRFPSFRLSAECRQKFDQFFEKKCPGGLAKLETDANMQAGANEEFVKLAAGKTNQYNGKTRFARSKCPDYKACMKQINCSSMSSCIHDIPKFTDEVLRTVYSPADYAAMTPKQKATGLCGAGQIETCVQEVEDRIHYATVPERKTQSGCGDEITKKNSLNSIFDKNGKVVGRIAVVDGQVQIRSVTGDASTQATAPYLNLDMRNSDKWLLTAHAGSKVGGVMPMPISHEQSREIGAPPVSSVDPSRELWGSQGRVVHGDECGGPGMEFVPYTPVPAEQFEAGAHSGT